jgi:hypothetical protein
MSSARPFIFVKYSATVEDPLVAFARAMRVEMTRARDCDAWCSWIAAQSVADVVDEETWEKISLESEEKR